MPSCSRSPTSIFLARSQAIARRADPAGAGLGARFPGAEGIVEALLEGLHAGGSPDRASGRHPAVRGGSAAELLLGETHLGYLGEIDQGQLDVFELREKCAAAELEFDVLLQMADAGRATPSAAAVPGRGPRPFARRGDALPWAELCETVVQAAGPTLETVRYLDTFQGGNISDARAERPFQHGLPAPGADADRRGSRARSQVGGRRVRDPVRRQAACLSQRGAHGSVRRLAS